MGIFNKKADQDKKEDKKAAAKPSNKKESMKDLYEGGAKETKKADKDRKFGEAYKVLVKPLITEKASTEGVIGKYTFEVSVDSNKISIARAIEEIYGIKPEAVNVINMKGKKVRYGRNLGKRKSWKKAVVTLPKGKTINIYEGV